MPGETRARPVEETLSRDPLSHEDVRVTSPSAVAASAKLEPGNVGTREETFELLQQKQILRYDLLEEKVKQLLLEPGNVGTREETTEL